MDKYYYLSFYEMIIMCLLELHNKTFGVHHGLIHKLIWITFIENWKNVDVWKNGTYNGHKHVHDITTEAFYFVSSVLPPDHGNTGPTLQTDCDMRITAIIIETNMLVLGVNRAVPMYSNRVSQMYPFSCLWSAPGVAL